MIGDEDLDEADEFLDEEDTSDLDDEMTGEFEPELGDDKSNDAGLLFDEEPDPDDEA